ncbi:MAG: hybrid sensor histidine kinase/response regulator [Candidatus Rokuibacteriota bacterium]|nr:MAG: hybrid sensor histidine kinase/response regulator [Candidatus Rokubacteria bacterium]
MTAGRILIVDDEPVNVRLLERLLQSAGYGEIATTTDPRRVLAIYRDFKPDLVLLDLMMPHLDGVAVLGQLKAEIPAEAYLPVIVLTADATAEAKRRALSAGARDFLTKPFEQFEMLLRIGNLLETRRLHVALAEHNRSLEETVRQRTEQLLQSEKVATMGALLAGVAHELNNPLAVVSGQAQLLHRPNQDPSVQHRAKRISDAADRCVRIVRNFLALARQRPPERSRTMLKEVLDGAVELLGYELRTDSVEVVVDVPEGLPVLWADPHQLHQVLVNLITNAHHAMRRQERPRRLSLTVRHDTAAGRVSLAIADTGAGIPREIQQKIFEAFFTTKAQGEGTGLGLSLCRSIVEEHGGVLTVESTVGVGTTFRIELPSSWTTRPRSPRCWPTRSNATGTPSPSRATARSRWSCSSASPSTWSSRTRRCRCSTGSASTARSRDGSRPSGGA